jgi:hypothetical protein
MILYKTPMNIFALRQPQNLLLLVVLLLLCIYTLLSAFFALIPSDGEYYRLLLTKANYAGFVAIASCFLSYFGVPQFFKRVLGITLLLALFNLVNFLPLAFSIGSTLGDFPIGVSPFGLLALVVFFFLNRSAANAFIRNYLLPVPTPRQAAQRHRETIDQFKHTFARKTDDGLRQIVQERKLVGDALTAAQELLVERGVFAAPT